MMSSQNPTTCNRSKIFKCDQQANKVLNKLRVFREDKEFTDIVLISKIDDTEIHAHRIVLCASSDYFLAMFRSSMKEAKTNEIEFKEMGGETLKLVLDFMYTASIKLHSENVENLLRAAHLFQMETLISACCDFVGDQLDAGNCLGVAYIAEQHEQTGLYNKAFAFALKNFERVSEENEFLHLDEEQLSKLISNDDLCVSSERKVFMSLLTWLEHDRTNREEEILNLLTHIRFAYLQPKFIIENRNALGDSPECKELIYSWLEWHLSPEKRAHFPSETTKKRKSNEKVAFASGEYDYVFKLQTYDPETNTWSFEDLPDLQKKGRSDYRTLVINNKLLIVGGCIDCKETNSVECLDLEKREWSYLPPMRSPRCLPGIIELNGDLYVVGGCSVDGDNWLVSVEKFDFSTNEWQNVAPLDLPLRFVKVAVVGGYLYAVGNNFPTMDCYDPIENEWTHKKFKNEKSEAFGFTGVNGCLYAVGGLHNGQASTTVECYDPLTDTWKEVCPLNLQRFNAKCVALNNKLITCRGSNRVSWMNIVEEYDPETNKWKTLASLHSHYIEVPSSSLFTM